MKVILDWVPNHTVFDHVWITQHHDWYVTEPDGTIINARDNEGHETDWTDVAELNYDKPAMRQAMIARHALVARHDRNRWLPLRRRRRRADGLLARGAARLLDGASADSSCSPRRRPAVHAAFDMTYGWELHHLLNEIAQGKRADDGARTRTSRERDSAIGRDAYRMYFTSNHDENSWNGTEFERMGANHVPAFVLARDRAGLDAAAVHGAGSEHEEAAALLREGHRRLERTVARAVLSLDVRSQAREPGALERRLGRAADEARDRRRRSRLRFHAHAGEQHVLVAVNFGDAAGDMSPISELPRPGTYTDWFTKTASRFNPQAPSIFPRTATVCSCGELVSSWRSDPHDLEDPAFERRQVLDRVRGDASTRSYL